MSPLACHLLTELPCSTRLSLLASILLCPPRRPPELPDSSLPPSTVSAPLSTPLGSLHSLLPQPTTSGNVWIRPVLAWQPLRTVPPTGLQRRPLHCILLPNPTSQKVFETPTSQLTRALSTHLFRPSPINFFNFSIYIFVDFSTSVLRCLEWYQRQYRPKKIPPGDVSTLRIPNGTPTRTGGPQKKFTRP